MREPNFDNILKVLKCQVPDRPTLFEFFMNQPLYERLAGRKAPTSGEEVDHLKFVIEAFTVAGYDYTTTPASRFHFPTGQRERKESISLNDAAIITDWESYERYEWPDPENDDCSKLEKIKPYLPENMKLIVSGPGGVLENVTSLVGYDNLCYMIYEDPELIGEIFNQVGSRLLKYYEIAVQYDTVGALISNDDWGFNTQTFLSPEMMRKYVFPWHKKIVQVIHDSGKPAILHSCGNFNIVMEDVIEDMKYDGKHSYEDIILPVEDSYERWCGRIAILGGIDVNFIINESEQDIIRRCKAMLERSRDRGGYALGTGNSVPEDIPPEKYLAMISCVE